MRYILLDSQAFNENEESKMQEQQATNSNFEQKILNLERILDAVETAQSPSWDLYRNLSFIRFINMMPTLILGQGESFKDFLKKVILPTSKILLQDCKTNNDVTKRGSHSDLCWQCFLLMLEEAGPIDEEEQETRAILQELFKALSAKLDQLDGSDQVKKIGRLFLYLSPSILKRGDSQSSQDFLKDMIIPISKILQRDYPGSNDAAKGGSLSDLCWEGFFALLRAVGPIGNQDKNDLDICISLQGLFQWLCEKFNKLYIDSGITEDDMLIIKEKVGRLFLLSHYFHHRGPASPLRSFLHCVERVSQADLYGCKGLYFPLLDPKQYRFSPLAYLMQARCSEGTIRLLINQKESVLPAAEVVLDWVTAKLGQKEISIDFAAECLAQVKDNRIPTLDSESKELYFTSLMILKSADQLRKFHIVQAVNPQGYARSPNYLKPEQEQMAWNQLTAALQQITSSVTNNQLLSLLGELLLDECLSTQPNLRRAALLLKKGASLWVTRQEKKISVVETVMSVLERGSATILKQGVRCKKEDIRSLQQLAQAALTRAQELPDSQKGTSVEQLITQIEDIKQKLSSIHVQVDNTSGAGLLSRAKQFFQPSKGNNVNADSEPQDVNTTTQQLHR